MINNVYPSRLREIKEAVGITSAELSRQTNIDPATLSKIELGRRGLSRNFARILADKLQVPVEMLYAEIGSPILNANLPMRTSHQKREVEQAYEKPTIEQQISLPATVPIYGSVSCGTERGSFLLTDTVIEYAPKGPKIQHRSDIYALYVEEENMEPWKRPGQLIYVDPLRPPRRGDRVIITTSMSRDASQEAFLMEYIKRTDYEIIVKQYNPSHTHQWSLDYLVSCHRILEPEEIF